jgi:hypothetical protein
VRQADPFLGFAHHDIDPRHFRGQDHKEIVVVGDRRAKTRI